ncbi:MAG: carboxypeptidase regulatory-like domain-containing protein [bacterium]
MRKTILTTVILLLLVPFSLAQISVTIGSTACSTSTRRLPWPSYHYFSETQYGIPASALAPLSGTNPITITSIGWIRCSGPTPSTDTYALDLYIDEVEDTYDLSSLCTSPYGNTNLVASNKLIHEISPDIFIMHLDTPFVYTPGKALIISVCDTKLRYDRDIYWAANVFEGNGIIHSTIHLPQYDCDMLTNEGDSCGYEHKWPTTVFWFTSHGNIYNFEMLPPVGESGATGVVEPVPGACSLPEGASMPIVAYPDFGSIFDCWELDGAWFSDELQETVLMNDDHTVQAFFKPFTALSFPVSEDFSGVSVGQLPLNWQTIPETTHWGVIKSNEAGGISPEMVLKGRNSSYTGQQRLIMPKIDGKAVSEILLMFKHYVYHRSVYADPYSLHVQTSIDDGATWVDRYSVTPSSDIGPGTLMVELDEVAGEEFYVSFLFDGHLSDIYNWYIDDIIMIADYKACLNGVIMNDQGPVEGAVVTVVETGTSAVTGPTGEYELPHMAGIYTIKCNALGHNVVIEPDIEIIAGTVVTQDFYLTYPLVDIYPTDFFVELDFDESTDEYLYLENSGTGPLNFKLNIKYQENKSSHRIGNWTDLTPTATAVQYPASCFGDGKFFVIGGLSDVSNDGLFNAIQIYDTLTGTWSVSAPMITPRHSSVAEYYNGKVYVIGGFNANFIATNAVQIYDVASDSWSAGATMPSNRGGASGGLINGKIYSLGGSRYGSFAPENVAHEYDIAGDFWTALNIGPILDGSGIVLGGGCAYKDKIYVGGHDYNHYYQFYEFNPAGRGTWKTKATIPDGLGGRAVSMIGLEAEGFILAVGGGYDSEPTGASWRYDPDTDTWTNLDKPMTTAVLGGACAAGFGEIYFYGGTTGSGPLQPAPFMMNTYTNGSWLTADITSGSVDPGDTGIVTLTFDARTVVSPGFHEAELTVKHNSGDETPLKIPVTIIVGGSGALEGFVYDDGRGIVQNAIIKILETDQTVKSDSTGFYKFPIVPIGLRTITCTADGFNPATITDVEIITGNTTTLDIHMAAPVLAIDPAEFFHIQGLDALEIVQDALTLENTGGGILDWFSSIEYLNRNNWNRDVLIAVHVNSNPDFFDPTSAYSAALSAVGYNVAATISAPEGGSIPFPTPFTVKEYIAAIVLTGDNWWDSDENKNLTSADEAALMAYQDTGGRVLLVSQDILWASHPTWGTASGWFKTHLGLQSANLNVLNNVPDACLTGAIGTFADGLNFTIIGKSLGGPFIAGDLFIDDLTPDTNAFVLWTASNGSSADAAIAFDNGLTKAVFSTAEFSAAENTSDFHAAIAAIMDFLDGWLRTTPESGSVLVGEPQSIGLTFDSRGLAIGEYRARITYKNIVTGAEVPAEITLVVDSNPPTPTPAPSTPTPTPECDYLGTHLVISQEDPFRTGDTFWLQCHVCNNTNAPMQQIATAVLLGVYGEFWFWPGWTQDFDLEHHDYLPGLTEIQVFEPFTWPDVQGTAVGLEFYSGLINAEMNDLIGEYGYLTFGYTDR